MNRRRTTERISKLLSLMLRHRPQEFDVEVDSHGFAPLDDVVDALQSRDSDITLEAVEAVVNEGPKQRFEIVEGRLRSGGHTQLRGVDSTKVQIIAQHGRQLVCRQGDRQHATGRHRIEQLAAQMHQPDAILE